ncbi:MAG TPA: serine hydrolase domain-containing protein [Planctomycetota bacterium]|nr:serine hydrolase domain-containing protein [Planctomycetota bacterium]
MMRCGALVLLALLGVQDDAALKSFDETMEAQLRVQKLTGASLAVVKDGRLVYAKGFGLGDVVNKAPVEASSLFRIASLSKPITAVAILKLAQDGKLDLEAKAFSLLDLKPVDEGKVDPRLKDVTVLNLLQHTGGWNRQKSGDPMFKAAEISAELGVPSPPSSLNIIRYMMNRPLDVEPGTRFAYSNFGYCVLGRIIEQRTGESYETYVKKAVLAPMGITRMTLGRSLRENREKDEVTYYPGAAKPGKPVFESIKEDKVPTPYGTFCLEAMDAHGGWLASAVDLVRFASSLDKVLNEKSLATMFGKPANAGNAPFFYGCGWMVRPVGAEGKMNTWHTGALPGSSTLLVRRHDGLVWAAFFNESLKNESLDPALHKAADAVTEWPKGDLFEKFK